MKHYITPTVMRLVTAWRDDDGMTFADLLGEASEAELITFQVVSSAIQHGTK